MLLLAALAAVATLPPAAGNAFFGSLHSNFVVNLDLEPSPPGGGEEALGGESHVIALAGGKRKFACHLPTGKGQRNSASTGADAAKAQQLLTAAKMAGYHSKCWTWHHNEDYWTYQVCPGEKITQYRPGSDQRFSLGDHIPESDAVRDDGSISEFYLGGTGNRSTEIRYVCGSSEGKKRTFSVEETKPLMYTIIISGPAFCIWKERSGSVATDPAGEEMVVSAFLEQLRNACVNRTEGWWTYEYCFPKGITQFHEDKGKRNPEYSLGHLSSTAEHTVDRVNMSIVRPKQAHSRTTPSGHRILQQRLGGGTRCDETLRPRATTMFFQCPLNWQSRPETQIVSIVEASLCEYEVVVETTLVCGHHRLLPHQPKAEQTIQCNALPGEL